MATDQQITQLSNLVSHSVTSPIYYNITIIITQCDIELFAKKCIHIHSMSRNGTLTVHSQHLFFEGDFFFSKHRNMLFAIFRGLLLLKIISDKVEGHGERVKMIYMSWEQTPLRQTNLAQKSTLPHPPLLPWLFCRGANKIRDSTSRAVISEVVSLYQLHPVSFFQRVQKTALLSILTSSVIH